jgi:hypothetical protein
MKTVEKFAIEIQSEFQMSGLYDGCYKDFTDELMYRTVDNFIDSLLDLPIPTEHIEEIRTAWKNYFISNNMIHAKDHTH